MSKRRLAIFGIGRWGKKLALELNRMGVLHSYVHSGNPENKKWAEENLKHCTSATVESVASSNVVEAVVIATPINTHPFLVHKMLMNGKHVFVEKPLTGDVPTVESLHALASKAQRVLHTGYIYTYDPALRAAAKSISKSKGSIVCSFVWEKWGTFDSPLITNLLVHDIAVATMLLGKPCSLEKPRIHVENNIDITVNHEYGESHISINRAKRGKPIKSITIADAEDTYVINPSSNLLRLELRHFLESLDTMSQQSNEGLLIDLAVAWVLERLKNGDFHHL